MPPDEVSISMMCDLSAGFGRFARAFAAASFVLAASAAVAQTPPPAAAPAAPVDPNAVVATVDGEKLTERDVQVAIDELAPGGAAAVDDQKREQIIGFLINVKLVAKAAEKEKLGDGPDFETRMKFLHDKALMQAYLEKLGKDGVTEDAVKKVYNDTVKEIKPEQEVHARHILVETEEDAKKAAERLAKGEDFAVVAKEMSKDPGSGAEGGDLGFFTKEQMVPEFADAAFKMEPGKVSEPVKSQYGWHIIKVEEKRDRAVPKLEEVRSQIEDYVHKKAQEDAVKKLLDNAKVERVGGPKKAEEPAPAPK
jgi:peptidyl-prolyl cis-trans isomerase C